MNSRVRKFPSSLSFVHLSAASLCLWGCVGTVAPCWAEEGAFEVKAVAVDTILYRQGKVERDKAGDEVVYQVNLPEGTVKRTAIFNKNVSDKTFGGLQSDNTVYQIVHNESRNPYVDQRLIKAVGKTGAIDGYETVIIGDDFVTTSKSTNDYFVLYHYRRTDSASERFREEKRSP